MTVHPTVEASTYSSAARTEVKPRGPFNGGLLTPSALAQVIY